MLGQFEIPWANLAGVNRRLRQGKGRWYLDPAYRTAKEIIWVHALNAARDWGRLTSTPRPVRRIGLEIELYPPNKGRPADIDSYIKVILDGMEDTFYANDSQVDRLLVRRRPAVSVAEARVIVTVDELPSLAEVAKAMVNA